MRIGHSRPTRCPVLLSAAITTLAGLSASSPALARELDGRAPGPVRALPFARMLWSLAILLPFVRAHQRHVLS
jgi:hypothetical protein